MSEPFGERGIKLTDRKKTKDKPRYSPKFSLKLSLAVFILLGAVCAVLTFVTLRSVITRAIDNDYLSTENKKEREKNYISSLQDYVVKNEITSKDTAKFSEWVKAQKYVYMLIYKDDQLFYASDEDYTQQSPPEEDPDASTPDSPDTDPDTSPDTDPDSTPDIDPDPDTDPDQDTDSDTDTDGGSTDQDNTDGGDTDEDPPANDEKPGTTPTTPGGSITVSPPTYEQLKEYAKKNNMHEIHLGDGSVFASITDFSEYLYYDIANIASIGAAMLVFALIIVIFFITIVSKISRLAADVNRVSGGDMEHSVRSNGNDEISRLSQDVDKMRNSILYNLKMEREARAANEELITSMSHDIRTPLTVLLGYLDIMKTASTDEQMDEYIRASENTAMRMKNLSDDMFNYFLVFGNKSDSAELREYEASPLLDQLLQEHILLLRELGYTVDVSYENIEGIRIITDAPNTMRIIDNLFSNLKKYADINEPISIKCRYEDRKLRLSFSNKQRDDSNDVESNGIGLKTCKKLAELLAIEFSYKEELGHFKTDLAFDTVL